MPILQKAKKEISGSVETRRQVLQRGEPPQRTGSNFASLQHIKIDILHQLQEAVK